jgi:Transglutaminase-like superfamily
MGSPLIPSEPFPSAPFLAATRYIDAGHPAIVAAAERATAGADTDMERAVRLHDLVRDMPFGWAPAFDEQKASEVLASGLGFCNTKSTLFAALLRASGIPARLHFAGISRRSLRGLITPPTTYVDHSWTEVLLDGRWIATDSYNVDPALHRAALARLRSENAQIGYGAHINGTCHWDGRSNSFSQFVDDGTVPDLSDADFGIHADIGAFYASGVGHNRPNPISRFAIRMLIIGANRRVRRLRDSLRDVAADS